MTSNEPRFSEDSHAITIVHVSDMQFGRNHRFADEDGGFETLRQRLCDDLDLLRARNGLRPDLLVLTGDLAEWGMQREFTQVEAFCAAVRDHLKLATDRVLIVPGNHDVNRKLCEAYFAECAGNDEAPQPPYWKKWQAYVGLFTALYRDVDRYEFTEAAPWTLFEVPELRVVVAGLNSTIVESHRDADHYGHVGEAQLRWFADRLVEYQRGGWLRLGLVHHNAVRGAKDDDENLRDADDLKRWLGKPLHLLLHGHTHRGRAEMLGLDLPVLSTGSAAVKREQRPGETPNQYQILRITRDGLWCGVRRYDPEGKRWVGETSVSDDGAAWWYELRRRWDAVDTTFPRPAPVSGPATHAKLTAFDGESGRESTRQARDEDFLDDVIAWTRMRDGATVTRVTRDCGRDYARVLSRVDGVVAIGVHDGDGSTAVVDRWIAEVAAPLRDRVSPVSKLIVRGTLDEATTRYANRRGVQAIRFVDYQRLLDTATYRDRLVQALARDGRYPSGFYVEQRLILNARESVAPAADKLADVLVGGAGVFALVLGQAGAGKSFLLREVVRRLEDHPVVTPILIELRHLEKAESIDFLVMQAFARYGLDWRPEAFRRLLDDGRLALLFDGFDELALRVRARAIPAHFEQLYRAAAGRQARVVVTSRTEHFASSGQVRDLLDPGATGAGPLRAQFEQVGRRQVYEIQPFTPDDVRAYLQRKLGHAPGEARYRRLRSALQLDALACNPRMLSFIEGLTDAQLDAAVDPNGATTTDALYRAIIRDAWLTDEAGRLAPAGAQPGPDRDALEDAARRLAVQLWKRPGGLGADEIEQHMGQLLLAMCDGDVDWAKQTAQSRTLLVRNDEGQFGFVHQTVLEWLVVGALEVELRTAVTTHLESGRLNAFILKLLRERVGDDEVAIWAQGVLRQPANAVVAENARYALAGMGRVAEAADADYRGADLTGQSLEGQSLVRARFDGAILDGVRVVGRDATGASFAKARLRRSDWSQSVLAGADLRGADLSFARFHDSDLTEAVLDGAVLLGASFLGARGLSSQARQSIVAAGGAVVADATSIAPMWEALIDWPRSVAFHPGGQLVAFASGAAVCLVDLATRRIVRMLAGHRGSVLCMAFAADGQTLASGSADATVRLWNADGSERATLTGHDGRVSSVAFAADGQTLASGSEDSTVRLWNADGSERATLTGHRGRVLSVAFAADGWTLASGSADDTVRLWDTNGNERATLNGHRSRVLSVAFAADGRSLASASDDGRVCLWNAGGGEWRSLTGHRGRVSSVAFAADGATMATGTTQGMVRLWNPDGSERAAVIAHRGPVLSVAFAADGATMATGGADDLVRLWNRDGSELTTLTGSRGSVLSVALAADGNSLAVGSDDGNVRLWNADGSERTTLTGHRGPVLSVAYAPDSQTLASGGDLMVRLWNADGTLRATLPGHRGRVLSVAFATDGQTLASGSDDASVRLWNADGSVRATLIGHESRVLSVAFAADGQTLASGSDDATVRLWNADGSERATLTGHRGRVLSVAFGADVQTLASGSDDDTVRLWNADGSERATLTGHRGSVLSVAFAADGQTLATGSSDATVRLWNADGSERATLTGHRGSVLSVAFAADGQTLASGSDDDTVRLWEVATGRCLAILASRPGGWIALRPDGRYRLVGDVDGAVWHAIGLHRYELGELDALVPHLRLRLADDEPLYTLG